MARTTPRRLFPWRQAKPLLVDMPPPDPTPFQNSEKLVEAVNTAAGTVAALHVAFMALSAYLAVTVWGSTHLDFLKESPVKLPLIDVQVDLTSFFGVAPWLYVLVHLNLLIQFYLLARKVWAFAESDDYPLLSKRLFVFPFVHYLLHLAGRFMQPLLAIAIFASVIAVPLMVLLYVQIKFLAYHSELITWSQRLAVWVDAFLLVWLWPRLASRSGRYWNGFFPESRIHGIASPWLASMAMLLLASASIVLALVALVPAQTMSRFSVKEAFESGWAGSEGHVVFFEGDVSETEAKAAFDHDLIKPDFIYIKQPIINLKKAAGLEAWLVRRLDRKNSGLACNLLVANRSSNSPNIPRQSVRRCGLKTDKADDDVIGKLGPTLWITAWLFDSQEQHQRQGAEADAGFHGFWNDVLRTIGAFFPDRYLDLHGEVLLKEVPAPEVLHAFKDDSPKPFGSRESAVGQDHDVTGCAAGGEAGADRFECFLLAGGWFNKIVPLSLRERDLRGANLQGAVLALADLSGAQLQGTDFRRVQLQGANLSGVSAQGSKFNESQLQGANLSDADFHGVMFRGASLQGALLSYSSFINSNFVNASLTRVISHRAFYVKANMSQSSLRGADFSESYLQRVNMDGVVAYGAKFVKSQLHGASLDGAKMQGCDFTLAQLQGALLVNTQLQGARLAGVKFQASVINGVQFQGASFGYEAGSFYRRFVDDYGLNLKRGYVSNLIIFPDISAALLVNVAVSGVGGDVFNSHGAVLMDLDETPLTKNQVVQISGQVQPFMSAEEFSLFTRRLENGGKQGSASILMNGECYGPEKLGCSYEYSVADFRDAVYFKELLFMMCGGAENKDIRIKYISVFGAMDFFGDFARSAILQGIYPDLDRHFNVVKLYGDFSPREKLESEVDKKRCKRIDKEMLDEARRNWF